MRDDNAKRKKILIVEDNVSLRKMYRFVLEDAGYVVWSVEDGTAAVELIKEETFDLILLDIMMLKMNGIDALKEMRREDSPAHDTPIILLTNMGQRDIIEDAFDIGADGFLLKADLLPEEVVDRVTQFLDGKIKSGEMRTSKSVV